MAKHSEKHIPLSATSQQYLHGKFTSPTSVFGAFAELIDNACDLDINAKRQWIYCTRKNERNCLIFMDNGAGLDYKKMLKMMSFAYSDKKTIQGRDPVGLYGIRFRSGAMHLGKDAIVFSKTRDTMSVGLLSQTYQAAIQAQHIVVPIVTYRQDGKDNFKIEQGEDCLKAILKHSLFKEQAELLRELCAINTTPPMVSTGTRIIIWNLGRLNGQLEFDLQTDQYDIQIPCMDLSDGYSHQDRRRDLEPESRYSLRAYCSILYLKPRMQIIIRGKKVRTQLVSKSLAHTQKDQFTPSFLKKPIRITFGYNPKTSANYGIMMYHENRLIRAYERVGCQRQAQPKGVGIIGIIECDFLKPTHIEDSEEYRKVKHTLGEKLEEYWNQVRHMKKKKDPKCTLAVEDMERSPDQNWVQCNFCQKWRKLPDGIDASRLPDEWFCFQNPDPQYRSCQVKEELEDSEDEQPYQRTYRQAISWEMRQQLENRQQNAAGAVSTLSTNATPSTSSGTSRYISGATAGGNVTRLTTPPSTPLSHSGCRPSAQNTPRIPFKRSAPTHPRNKRGQFSLESEPLKRAKVKDHGLSSTIQETQGGINPQLHDGAFADCYRNQVQTANQKRDLYKKQVETANQERDQYKEQLETANQERDCYRDQVQTANQERDLYEEMMETSAEQRDQYKEQLETASQERDCYRDQVETANKERDQYKKQVETANQERDCYRDQVETANQERDLYKEQMETANQERDCYRDQVETVKQERDLYKEQMEATNQERDCYRNQVQTANQERDLYKGQMGTAKQVRDYYRCQMETANKERDQYKKQVETANQERDQYKEQLETANQERDCYMDQVQTANQERDLYEEMMETSAQQRDQYKKQVETANQERNCYRDQVETANKERDQYKKQVETANQERDCYRDQVETANQERDLYKKQVETANQERDLYKEQTEAANQERDCYRNQVQTANQERDLYKGQMGTAKQVRDYYRCQMETANKERDQYKKQVETANQERDQYKEQLETANQERDCFRDQVQTANQERDLYEEMMETSAQQRDQYKEQVDKLNEELQTIRNDLSLHLDSVLMDLDGCNEERE